MLREEEIRDVMEEPGSECDQTLVYEKFKAIIINALKYVKLRLIEI